MEYSKIALLLCSLVVYVAADCWETSDCHQNSWNTKGCAQYGRVEQSKRACNGGYYYTCCTGGSGGSSSSPSGSALSGSGKTTRYWDCCKPSCSWDGKGPVTSPVKTCDKKGVSVLSTSTTSGCNGGSAYVCNNQQPFVENNVAYGFAAGAVGGQGEYQSCCACYELTFTSGPVNGKKMIVQVTNTGGDLGYNHFDLMIPGGGVGIFNGCSSQWGAPGQGWGKQYGGIEKVEECSQLPSELREGCKFRFGWFQNADNPTMNYKKVTCPSQLTSRSGCVRTQG